MLSVMWQVLTNQSALFQSRVVIALWNFVMRLAPRCSIQVHWIAAITALVEQAHSILLWQGFGAGVDPKDLTEREILKFAFDKKW